MSQYSEFREKWQKLIPDLSLPEPEEIQDEDEYEALQAMVVRDADDLQAELRQTKQWKQEDKVRKEERQFKTKEREEDREFELSVMLNKEAFQREAQESDQSFKERMTKLNIKSDEKIAQMNNSAKVQAALDKMGKSNKTTLEKNYERMKADNPGYKGTILDFHKEMQERDPDDVALGLAAKDWMVMTGEIGLLESALNYKKTWEDLKGEEIADTQLTDEQQFEKMRGDKKYEKYTDEELRQAVQAWRQANAK